MMTLLNFLLTVTLIENTHDIFDYSVFVARFNARYGQMNIRADLTTEQIKQYAQNVIDVNVNYYKTLFTHIIDPFKTWGENGSNNGNVTVINTDTETNDLTTTNTDNTTITSSGDNTTTTENSGAENNFKNAYNTPNTPTPTDNSTSSANGKNINNYNDTTTNERSATTKNGGTKTNVLNGTTTNTNTNTRTGWTNSDAFNTMARYIPAYDIIINDIAAIILDNNINIWE